MSSQYNGQTANVMFQSQKSVSAATNLTPIQITTTVPHQLTTGDLVNVAGVAGNTAANGDWPISVVDASNFLLVGSAGNGAYTTGGTVQSLGMGTTYPIPSDGDARNAASVNGAFESLGDRTAVLGASVGAYRLLKYWNVGVDDPTENASWTGGTITLSVSTWAPLYAIFTSLTDPLLGFLQAGDIIEMELSATYEWAESGSSGGEGVLLGLGIGYFVAGGTPTIPAKIPNSGLVLGDVGSSLGLVTSGRSALVLRARAVVPANVQSAGISLMSFTRSVNPTHFDVDGIGDMSFVGSVWRQTGKPQ